MTVKKIHILLIIFIEAEDEVSDEGIHILLY